MSKLYLGFNETMYGTYDDGKQFDFTVKVSAPLKRMIKKGENFMVTDLEGTVTMEGVCEEQPIQDGRLVLDLLGYHKKGLPQELARSTLDYSFTFNADGKEFAYDGSKYVTAIHPLKSMTSLYGDVWVNSGGPDGSSPLFIETPRWEVESIFKLKQDLPKFLLSFLTSIKLR